VKLTEQDGDSGFGGRCGQPPRIMGAATGPSTSNSPAPEAEIARGWADAGPTIAWVFALAFLTRRWLMHSPFRSRGFQKKDRGWDLMGVKRRGAADQGGMSTPIPTISKVLGLTCGYCLRHIRLSGCLSDFNRQGQRDGLTTNPRIPGGGYPLPGARIPCVIRETFRACQYPGFSE
jgi:hypothetical protein